MDRSLQSSCVSCFKEAPPYKCPKCMARYCSVACFNTHKARTSCTGMKDIKDAVIRYISRTELMGTRGYADLNAEANDESGAASRPQPDEDEREIEKRQRIGDRDYNFLSLIERRIGVQKNIAQDALRRGSSRLGRRGRGRGRGGRGQSSTRVTAQQNDHSSKNTEAGDGRPSDVGRDTTADPKEVAAENEDEHPAEEPIEQAPADRIPDIREIEDGDDDDDGPPEEISIVRGKELQKDTSTHISDNLPDSVQTATTGQDESIEQGPVP
ncbi:hypothetical protein BZA70DRAFT_278261 [Myxozyma melibiosi]|uniref:HIT-type domain-containing protein n=1 Tax=Myxozyma melibiosi TaxID=54550 RepID=A0ABR1F6L6_9ASCO